MAMRERRKRIYRKRIPYGMQNFEDVIKEDCYYVDKTPFIEDIEESNMYFFYMRPRRFGKSLTLSMLENYYDINKKDKFEEIFGKLYIGELQVGYYGCAGAETLRGSLDSDMPLC